MNVFANLIAQLILRFASKSPLLFRVIQIAAIVLGASSAAIKTLASNSAIASNKVFVILDSSVTVAIEIVGFILASLPVSSESKNINKISGK